MLTAPVAASLPGSYDTEKSSEKNFSVFLNIGDITLQEALPEKNVRSESEKKISSALRMETTAPRLAASPHFKELESSVRIKNVPVTYGSTGSQTTSLNLPSGKLAYVYVYVKPGYSTHIIDSSVYEVENRDENYHIAVAWVDVEALETLAALEGVRTIREVIPPVVNTGSVTTAGDTIHKTTNVRLPPFNARGAGMKIGIISDGVDTLASAVASGDLPSDVTVLSNTRGGDEGTAMLEIVHDMAPDAKLYFHDMGANMLAFNAGIDALIANGCTVICDDIGWFGSPSFEDGIVASHIKTRLTANNLVYISSAGNAAQKHYQGSFYKAGTTNWTDFSQGTNPTATSLYVNLSTGSEVNIVLHWNDQWGHSGNDYDLYLHNMNGSIITYSDDAQSGSGDPLEFITYNHTGPMMDAKINVLNYRNLAQTKNLELFIFTRSARVYLNNINSADSIYGHQAVPDVITVAAVPATSPSTIEAFSSRGPVTISYPTPETRQKPDISGVDGVAVTGAGGFSNPFYGTSAAAPHIAAIVAQYWGAHPTMTPSQVRAALYANADDLGSAGKDTIFGSGLANALKMADAVSSDSSPVVGNWNSDLSADAGIFRPSTGYWFFDNNLDGTAEKSFRYGGSTDRIIVGKWQGTNDGIAIFRPSTGYWYFDYNLDGTVDKSLRYGGSSDQIIKGNWQGTNDGIAIFRPSTGYWYFDYNLDGVVNKSFRYGGSTDRIIVGKWQGANDGIAIFRPSTGYWYFDYNLDGVVNQSFRYGGSSDTIIKGDWNGDGTEGIGIFRPSTGYWYLDYNLDGVVDKSFRMT
jgi:hypothetical protein